MSISKILRKRFYLALSLVYIAFVVALCLHAPVVQQSSQSSSSAQPNFPPSPVNPRAVPGDTQPTDPIVLDPDEVAGYDPQRGPDIPSTQVQSDGRSVPQTLPADFGGWDEDYALMKKTHAPLWKLGPKISLDTPVFAAEQAEVIGLLTLVAVLRRLRARLMIWAVALSAYIQSRRCGTCIWLGFAVMLLLALVPPWVQINTYGGRSTTQRVKLWHAPIFRAPIDATEWESCDVDYSRMLMEAIVGEGAVAALYLTWARTKTIIDSKNQTYIAN